MQSRYVYYKVPRERLASVCAAVRCVQQAWVAREPGLQAQLLLRHDEAARSGAATLMEIWTWPQEGHDPVPSVSRWARLEEELCAALGDALVGERHIEAFGPAPG